MRLLLLILWSLAGSLAAQDFPLRIVTGNLTSGNQQSYDPGHGARIFQGLKPDIALIQEFKTGDNSPQSVASWVHSVFGPKAVWFREEAELPNGIVSQYPILESGEWDDPTQTNRDFAWAHIDLPGAHDLWAISLHISAGKMDKRIQAAKTLVGLIKKNIPPGDFLVIGGDFNTRSRQETAIKTISAVVQTDAPYPTDESGNENTNAKRVSPYDWVLVNDSLQKLNSPSPLGGSPAGLVFDSRVYSDLSKVSPALMEDSDAPQMQHMAVVRDFIIPNPQPVTPEANANPPGAE